MCTAELTRKSSPLARGSYTDCDPPAIHRAVKQPISSNWRVSKWLGAGDRGEHRLDVRRKAQSADPLADHLVRRRSPFFPRRSVLEVDGGEPLTAKGYPTDYEVAFVAHAVHEQLLVRFGVLEPNKGFDRSTQSSATAQQSRR
ncbi:hypothetical protein GCM10027597_25810 [Saccharopolyspora tripterygii]